ncbi:MAG TPA: addiction module protein [Thermoanaerobaculia bacterium]|jgi:putative addiction module component (TIGR02574 family)|nr:addiction module protein [Thermoanaerobaculia bacterium]
MAQPMKQLKSQLAQLSARDKAELASFLLGSLEPEDEGVAAAWDLEIARRVDEIQSGRASGTPAEEVFAELRQEFP